MATQTICPRSAKEVSPYSGRGGGRRWTWGSRNLRWRRTDTVIKEVPRARRSGRPSRNFFSGLAASVSAGRLQTRAELTDDQRAVAGGCVLHEHPQMARWELRSHSDSPTPRRCVSGSRTGGPTSPAIRASPIGRAHPVQLGAAPRAARSAGLRSAIAAFGSAKNVASNRQQMRTAQRNWSVRRTIRISSNGRTRLAATQSFDRCA